MWVQVPIKIVFRNPPMFVHNQRIFIIYHKGDVAKLEILLEYGGIYLDFDVIVVNSLDPLRRFDATLGKSSQLSHQLTRTHTATYNIQTHVKMKWILNWGRKRLEWDWRRRKRRTRRDEVLYT